MPVSTDVFSLDTKTSAYGGDVEYPPFSPVQMHVHEQCEIFCVFRGSGYYITEGARHKLQHGRIFLMRTGESHMRILTDSEPYDRIAYHFWPSAVDGIDPERRLLSPFFDRPLGECNVYDRSVVAPTRIYELLSKLSYKTDDAYQTDLNRKVLLLSILSELKRLFDEKLYLTPAKGTEQMRTIVEYINKTLTKDISVNQICEKFFLSRAQLHRNFKSTTGSTVWEYIMTKRLLLAKSYIADGMTASKAASSCGFGDYSSFYRAYTKKYGSPPSGNTRIV